MTIQGLRPYEFEDKQGKVVKGVSVYCSFTDEHISGTGVEKFSISDEKLGDIALKLGMEVEPLYNKYGKISGLNIQ